MRTYQTTVREGENLGPVDWAYDFHQHGWNRGGSFNPSMIDERVNQLRQLAQGGEWQATTDGGWPRVGWHKVLEVGMYDGWPYWKPVPSVLTMGPLGSEWHSFLCITGIEKLQEAQRTNTDASDGTT